jgi:REP element-mobilizing transposase RayT
MVFLAPIHEKRENPMSRKMRLFIPGGVYHVYCRISRGEMVFTIESEMQRLMAELLRVKQRDELTVFAWAVLGNHYHVGLRTATVPLWRTMASVQGRMARGFNRQRGIRGPLWQSRYKARIVDSQQYFNHLLAYIHLNPVAAGLAYDPADYPWSGHREIMGLRRPELVDVEEALLSFDENRSVARKRYLLHVRSCAEARWSRKGVRSLPWWSSVKDNEELVTPRFGNDYWDYLGARINIERPDVSLERLLCLVCEHLDLDQKRLVGCSRRGSDAEARKLFTLLAIERYGHRVVDVSKLIQKNPGSVSRLLAQAKARCEDDSLLKQIEDLDRHIIAIAAPARG